MLTGIACALLAGTMLGLYALPGKYTKNFEEENKWSLFFLLTMFVVPLAATFGLMKDVGGVFGAIETSKLVTMVVASFLWGTGVMLWGKAIDHIGVSLGFCLFIGTVILVGSVLPLGIAVLDEEKSLPASAVLATQLAGIAVVLVGVIANGKAGLVREADESAASSAADSDDAGSAPAKKSYATGVLIAVVGGLLATGFSVANAVGGGPLGEAVIAAGNPAWMTAMAVMLPVFLSGGVVMTAYFGWQLSSKKAWGRFATPSLPWNAVLIFVMAFFHYAASAVFAYASFALGDSGPVVGYAIFNTTCLVVAAISGLVTGEWAKASPKAKNWLFLGMSCMVGGVLILTASKAIEPAPPAEATEAASAVEAVEAPAA